MYIFGFCWGGGVKCLGENYIVIRNILGLILVKLFIIDLIGRGWDLLVGCESFLFIC